MTERLWRLEAIPASKDLPRTLSLLAFRSRPSLRCGSLAPCGREPAWSLRQLGRWTFAGARLMPAEPEHCAVDPTFGTPGSQDLPSAEEAIGLSELWCTA